MAEHQTKTPKHDAHEDVAKPAVSAKIAENVREVREKVGEAAEKAGRATTDTLDANPFGALAGAIAVGAVAAAMIPVTRQELQTLGPWAEKMREELGEAFAAAREAGGTELNFAGLSAAISSNGVGGVVERVVKALSVATEAATSSVKERRSGATTSSSASTATDGPSGTATEPGQFGE